MTTNWQKMQNPSEWLCVDECMVPYAGRYCPFKQYIPSKPTRYGIKVWALCSSDTKYMYNCEVYVGANVSVDTEEGEPRGERSAALGSGYGVVMRLTEGLENFFTSPRLFEDMLQRGFYCVGTACQNRKGFPRSLNYGNKQLRGTLHVRVHRDRQMAAVHWTDCKGVHLLSTAVGPVEPGLQLPRHTGRDITMVSTTPMQVVYTQNMRGIDVHDQYRATYTTMIWSKK
jgi:hypothetical protein